MMKKLLLLFLLLIVLLPLKTNAQQQYEGHDFLKIQFAQPLGQYKDYYNSGVGVEFGRKFPFKTQMANGLLIPGLDITFISTSFNTGKEHDYFTLFNTSTNEQFDFKTQSGLMWALSMKIGPMVTMGLADGLLLDVALQYDPSVVFNFRKGVNAEVWQQDNIVDKKTATSISFAHLIGLKADLRYSHFLFGLEFKFGSTGLSYNHKIISHKTTDSSAQTIVKFTDEKDMGLTTLLLNFGFVF